MKLGKQMKNSVSKSFSQINKLSFHSVIQQKKIDDQKFNEEESLVFKYLCEYYKVIKNQKELNTGKSNASYQEAFLNNMVELTGEFYKSKIKENHLIQLCCFLLKEFYIFYRSSRLPVDNEILGKFNLFTYFAALKIKQYRSNEECLEQLGLILNIRTFILEPFGIDKVGFSNAQKMFVDKTHALGKILAKVYIDYIESSQSSLILNDEIINDLVSQDSEIGGFWKKGRAVLIVIDTIKSDEASGVLRGKAISHFKLLQNALVEIQTDLKLITNSENLKEIEVHECIVKDIKKLTPKVIELYRNAKKSKILKSKESTEDLFSQYGNYEEGCSTLEDIKQYYFSALKNIPLTHHLDINKAKEEQRKIKDLVNTTEKSLDEITKEISSLSKEIEGYKNGLKKHRKRNRAKEKKSKQKCKREEGAIKNRNNKTIYHLKQLEHSKQKLEKDNFSLNEKMQALTLESNKAQSESMRMDREIAKFEEDISLLKRKITLICTQLDSIIQKKNQNEALNHKLSKERRQLENKKYRVEHRPFNLEDTLEISNLKKQVNQVVLQIKSLADESKLEDQVISLQDEVKHKEELLASLQQKEFQTKKSINEISSEIHEKLNCFYSSHPSTVLQFRDFPNYRSAINIYQVCRKDPGRMFCLLSKYIISGLSPCKNFINAIELNIDRISRRSVIEYQLYLKLLFENVSDPYRLHSFFENHPVIFHKIFPFLINSVENFEQTFKNNFVHCVVSLNTQKRVVTEETLGNDSRYLALVVVSIYFSGYSRFPLGGQIPQFWNWVNQFLNNNLSKSQMNHVYNVVHPLALSFVNQLSFGEKIENDLGSQKVSNKI